MAQQLPKHFLLYLDQHQKISGIVVVPSSRAACEKAVTSMGGKGGASSVGHTLENVICNYV